MQLRSTRLCLDCEELHEANQCPACASEAFAFLTQWLPAEERPREISAVRRQTFETEGARWPSALKSRAASLFEVG